ncbi:hypothetical protein EDM56_08035 [Brevibacillus fluminis]|uniref:Uncharacterized protein n=1 Tax=Brevibacillus fluminis TaxID=511487 RepID=A0A3M8DSJ0_9BACL|nr:hypothetical protein [Brevibacillus fluminis]RNB90449.1 hypothetical protein EDM56_08035 [Brevibacillus fluminis]
MKAARLYLCLLGIAMCFLVGFSSPEKKSKATWIWQAELIGKEQQQILTFCKQNEINLIYLRIDQGKPDDDYRAFIRQATANGIEVHAVGGHPTWALASGKSRMLQLAKWVKRYNEQADSDERIKGIQLDVEPYMLKQWETDQEDVLVQWQANVKAFMKEAGAESDLQIGTALAFWLDEIPAPNQPDMSMGKWMISQFDTVTIMAYRNELDGRNGILSLVEKEMSDADELHKPAIIAVNMKKMNERHTSYADVGAAEMNRQLAQLPQEMAAHPSFAGTAVHDFRYWKQADAPSEEVPPVEVPATKGIKGTYIWEAEQIMSEPDEILAFAKEHGLNFLYARLDLDQPFSVYRNFVKKAHAAGIEVQAMGGHPIWALEQNRPRIMRLVKWVKNYNAHVEKDERFQGIHLDIEPYVMPIWRTDKESLLRQWMGNIRAFVQETKDSPDLKTSVDLAVWLENTPTPGEPELPFSNWMIKQVDQTTLMAFRDHAEGPGGIVDIVKNKMAYADSIGKPLMVAVEMKESHEGNYVSFHEEGKAEMNRQLELMASHLEKYDSYSGFVVHAYDYWKTSKE